MSLSSPKTTSPVSRYIEWQGSTGKFRSYNKEKKDYDIIEGPIYIVVLDQLSCVSGYNDDAKKGIFSNEVHNTSTEELSVRYFGGGQIATGLYNDIKGSLPSGYKFAKSVYAALIDPDTTSVELVNFKFSGSSIGPWIDAKVGDDGRVVVMTTNPIPQKKGQTTYYEPIVKKNDRREDIIEKCVELDKELQQYLYSPRQENVVNDYKQHNVYEAPEPQPEPTNVQTDDLPF